MLWDNLSHSIKCCGTTCPTAFNAVGQVDVIQKIVFSVKLLYAYVLHICIKYASLGVLHQILYDQLISLYMYYLHAYQIH